MAEHFDEQNQITYVCHKKDANVQVEENLLYIKSGVSLIDRDSGRLRSQRDWVKINRMLTELNDMKIGPVTKFNNTSYVKINVPQEGELWITGTQFERCVAACEAKTDWWFERDGWNLKVHRIAHSYTAREEAVLKAYILLYMA